MTEPLNIQRVDNPHDSDLLALVKKSDDYLSVLYPPDSNHAEPLEALMGEQAAFFVGHADDQLVACVGVKLATDEVAYGEIKRLFVDES